MHIECKSHPIYAYQVTRSTTVKDIGGSEFYLRDVIAHALHYLKAKVLDSLKKRQEHVKASDLDWVITVPAIWNAQGKQMMREAGYQVIIHVYCVKQTLVTMSMYNVTVNRDNFVLEIIFVGGDCLIIVARTD